MVKQKNKLRTFVLLDRSGSMGGSKWENAIGSINTYVNELKKDSDIDGEITVAAFDSFGGVSALSVTERNNVRFEKMRDRVDIKEFVELDYKELTPYGGTPLYDATALLLNLADENPTEKTIILIMTDGEENQSSIYNLRSIKDRLDTCRHRGWEVTFMGAEFSVDNTAQSLGFGLNKTLSATRSVDLGASMAFYSVGAASYAKGQGGIDTTSMKSKVEK